jgi:AcrR family transcriptional regulator
MATEPAYTRMPVDERRAQLLKLGTDLFTRHSYDELSMARIAKEAGISKPLLYHYFPSKQEYFQATLAGAAEELQKRTEPPEGRPPLEQLDQAIDGYLGWIEENGAAYSKLIESAASIPDVRLLIDDVRTQTVERILSGLYGDSAPPALVRAAALGWLWFMDGAIHDWLRQGDFGRDELKGLLMGALVGTLAAAGAGEQAVALTG